MLNMNEVNIYNRPYFVCSIFGMRGYGKTYYTTDIIEFLHSKTRVIVLDIVGAVETEIKRRNHIDFVRIELEDRNISYDSVAKALDIIFSTMKSNVIIFNYVFLNRKSIIEYTDYICQYLKKKRIECALIVDEIGEVLSQDKVFYSEELESIIRVGRNLGVKYVVLNTQRLQKVNKHAIALSDIYVVFRMLHVLDIRVLKELVSMDRGQSMVFINNIKQFSIGQRYIYDGEKIIRGDRHEDIRVINGGEQQQLQSEAQRDIGVDKGAEQTQDACTIAANTTTNSNTNIVQLSKPRHKFNSETARAAVNKRWEKYRNKQRETQK